MQAKGAELIADDHFDKDNIKKTVDDVTKR